MKLKIKFKIKILVVWSIFEGWLDQKQRIYFAWPNHGFVKELITIRSRV